MNNGERYVVNSADTLYYLPNSSCNEGDTITLNNAAVQRVYLVNGQWLKGYTSTLGSYNNTYICHVWDRLSSPVVSPIVLPLCGCIVSLCLFNVIFHWFIRYRG